MAITRPFAYNTGSTISGTIQVGDLAVGEPSTSIPGVSFWNGPDEEIGFVIAVPVSGNTQPTPESGVYSSVGFYRTQGFSTNGFKGLAQFVANKFNNSVTFSSDTEASNWMMTNGFWNSYIDPTPTPTPSPTPSPTPTPTPSPTPSPTPTPTPSPVSGVTFSQTFTSGVAPGTTIETAWTTFRGQLTGTYTKFDFFSSNGQGYTGITDSIKVQQLANALRTGTTGANLTVNISGTNWVVSCCACRAGGAINGAVEFSNVGGCSGSSTASLRPFINNNNWGGIGSTVGAATQTLTLKFY
jgi:hypothetical protein